MDNAVAKRVLFEVADVLEEEGITFWLICGTLLGAMREKDFIAWDKDIDLGFYQNDFSKVKETLKGFRIYKRRRTVIKIIKDKIKVDICGFEKNGEWWNYYIYPKPRVLATYYKGYIFDSLEKIEFLGREFNTPSMPERYLAGHYFNWKIPRPSRNGKHKEDYRCMRNHEEFWASFEK